MVYSAMLCPTFATSSKVTGETMNKLNSSAPEDADFPPEWANYFIPVRTDPSQMLQPSKSLQAVDFIVDSFDQSPKELDKLHGDVVCKQMRTNGYLSTMAFAVLDERSADDDTVVVYFSDETFDRETGDITGEILRNWRVPFTDAHDLVGLLEHCGYPVMEAYVFEACERFTNQHGVFEFTKGIKTMKSTG